MPEDNEELRRVVVDVDDNRTEFRPLCSFIVDLVIVQEHSLV